MSPPPSASPPRGPGPGRAVIVHIPRLRWTRPHRRPPRAVPGPRPHPGWSCHRPSRRRPWRQGKPGPPRCVRSGRPARLCHRAYACPTIPTGGSGGSHRVPRRPRRRRPRLRMEEVYPRQLVGVPPAPASCRMSADPFSDRLRPSSLLGWGRPVSALNLSVEAPRSLRPTGRTSVTPSRPRTRGTPRSSRTSPRKESLLLRSWLSA